ncbi:hypothetical protein B0H14DRAFT_2643052 [Mycena olivaceomarginata]|nr:hypothetical protein B0H14DRAFT_2643052 [Mycena olivaceomarginata]
MVKINERVTQSEAYSGKRYRVEFMLESCDSISRIQPKVMNDEDNPVDSGGRLQALPVVSSLAIARVCEDGELGEHMKVPEERFQIYRQPLEVHLCEDGEERWIREPQVRAEVDHLSAAFAAAIFPRRTNSGGGIRASDVGRGNLEEEHRPDTNPASDSQKGRDCRGVYHCSDFEDRLFQFHREDGVADVGQGGKYRGCG